MPAKKRCQFKSDPPCTSAVLRIVGHCPHCSSEFCGNHRLPEVHSCTNMEDCRQQAFNKNKEKLEREQTTRPMAMT